MANFAALAALEIFVAVNAPMLAFGDLAADGFFIVNLAAVGTEVIPLRVRILGDAHVRGADVAVRVRLMMDRHRQFEHVHLVAFQNIFEDRPGLDHLRLDQLHLGHAMMIGLDDVGFVFVFERQTEGQGDALDGRELAVKRAIALRIARHFIKENRRRLALAGFGEHLRDGAHLSVPVGAINPLQFTELLHLLQPVAQTMVADRARGRHRFFPVLPCDPPQKNDSLIDCDHHTFRLFPCQESELLR